MEIIMKTFYGEDGNYSNIPLSKVLDMMTDDWIDDNMTGENTSELRDACRSLLERSDNSDYAVPPKLPSLEDIEKNMYNKFNEWEADTETVEGIAEDVLNSLKKLGNFV